MFLSNHISYLTIYLGFIYSTSATQWNRLKLCFYNNLSETILKNCNAYTPSNKNILYYRDNNINHIAYKILQYLCILNKNHESSKSATHRQDYKIYNSNTILIQIYLRLFTRFIITTVYNYLQLFMITTTYHYLLLLTTTYYYLLLLTTTYYYLLLSQLLTTIYDYFLFLTTTSYFLRLLTTTYYDLPLLTTTYPYLLLLGAT